MIMVLRLIALGNCGNLSLVGKTISEAIVLPTKHIITISTKNVEQKKIEPIGWSIEFLLRSVKWLRIFTQCTFNVLLRRSRKLLTKNQPANLNQLVAGTVAAGYSHLAEKLSGDGELVKHT